MIFILNMANIMLVMNFYLNELVTDLNYVHRHFPKAIHTGAFQSSKQGFPPVDINSTFWGEQNQDSENMVNGITPRFYNLTG